MTLGCIRGRGPKTTSDRPVGDYYVNPAEQMRRRIDKSISVGTTLL